MRAVPTRRREPMSQSRASRGQKLIELLGTYRRPGTPVFAYHYRRLPAEVLELDNADLLAEFDRLEREWDEDLKHRKPRMAD